jgi:hypothetical protein
MFSMPDLRAVNSPHSPRISPRSYQQKPHPNTLFSQNPPQKAQQNSEKALCQTTEIF